MTSDTTLHVAVGVIERDGQILLSRRALEVHQGGKWEFPGGKLEAGECVTEALARELKEELGITPVDVTPLIQIPFTYSECQVFLDVWRVTTFHGVPVGLEGQEITWSYIEQLDDYDFPAANRPIIQALRLPRCIAITPLESSCDAVFCARLESLVSSGCLVHLRQPEVNPAGYSRLVRQLAEQIPLSMSDIVLTSNLAEVTACGASGLHLNSQRLLATDISEAFSCRVSASCHNLKELKKAESMDLRYAFLSPVLPTLSHPGAPALGWERFGDLVRQVGIPVYALGGVGPESYETARSHGAQGVAGIRGFW